MWSYLGKTSRKARGIRLPSVVLLAAGLLILVLASACGDSAAVPQPADTTEATTKPTVTAEATTKPIATKDVTPNATSSDETPKPELPEFDAANFGLSTIIDNAWYPLEPGTKWVYEGTTTEGKDVISHRIEFTVTDLTKEILGVRTVVALIKDFSDGELIEKEIAFYAQDDDGSVWYLGEHPEEYEGGKFIKASTWIAGYADARAGIKMWADPYQPELPVYYQGWAPAVEWSDYAQVDQVGQKTCVPVGCFTDVLVLAESSLDEIGIYQIKSYAMGIGEVRVGSRGAAESIEELELVKHTQLGADALAAVRRQALKLEAHAYEISEDVYGKTAPSQQIPIPSK
jgi:hypothetical protein